MKALLPAAVASLLLAGCADRDATMRQSANQWAIESATPVAAPVDCIARSRIRGQTALDDRTIDFVLDDNRVMRNRLPMQCSGLAREQRFIQRTGLDRLCSTDVITLIQADGSTGAGCGLGRFQEVAIPPRPAPLR